MKENAAPAEARTAIRLAAVNRQALLSSRYRRLLNVTPLHLSP